MSPEHHPSRPAEHKEQGVDEPVVLRQGGETDAAEASEGTADDAIAFVESHKDLFEHIARGKINCKPAPPGLDTFAFDLETNDLYICPRFHRVRGFSEEGTTFATLHEIGHLKDKLELLREKDGAKIFERYLARLKRSKAYGHMDNCVADTHVNEEVVAETNEELARTEHTLYTEHLFPDSDMTGQPRHIQFSEALLRESRVPDQLCAVAPEVRAALDEVKGITSKNGARLLDIVTHPETPMSTRLKLQDGLIWPQVEKLLEQDMKEEEEKQKQKVEQEKQAQEESEKQEQGPEQEGDKPQDKPPQGKSDKGQAQKAERKPDPNDVFKEAYEAAEKRNPHAVPIEDQQKALKDWKEGKGSPRERADQEYAEQLGVSKEALQRYRAIAGELQKIINPETNQSAIDDLREMIERIIAHRHKERQAPQYPVEEGDYLTDPAELVTQVKAGNWEPKVWETQEIRVEKGKRFGKVEITLVGDRSTSMLEDGKAQEQQKAAVLFMEALKEFGDRLKEEAINLEKPLSVASEVYTFQSSAADATPLKAMSEELSEKERIHVVSELSTCSGTTTDFASLEAILGKLSEDARRDMQNGELKKIVVVFTDGVSDDPTRVSRALEKLRAAGVIVVGVGITLSGAPARTTYAPTARLAETALQLPIVLTEVLAEHLADL